MKLILASLVSIGLAGKINRQQANQFLLSRHTRESDCRSMPGGEEFCREESMNSNSDYSLSQSKMSSNTNGGIQYEQYTLDGQTSDFEADNSYDSLMNYDK